MTGMSGVIGTRWAAARRLGGYGAAASLSLYLAVKVVWVAAAAFGHVPAHFGGADWIVLNVVTVGMSATGIALGLVLARGMRWRIPAAPLVFLTWVGGGFLIPLMPYSLVSALLGGGGEETGGDAAPSWEMTFIGIGFTGMAIGLAIALPIYMRERWPAAFLGRLSDRNRTAVGRARTAAVLTAVPAAFWTLWSAGAELGLDPAHRDLVDVNTRLLLGDSALWALLGVWSVLAVSSARPNTPAWLPTAIGFTASGSLFAWGGWKLAVAVFRPGGYTSAEYPIAAIALNGLAAAGGLLMLSTLLASLRASEAPPANAPPANAQTGNAQTGNAPPANARTGNVQTGNVQTGNVQTGNVQTGNVQSGNVQSGNVQTGNAQAGEG
ncbi:hypothetical protein [Actinomadura verrucosospora]|uniref:hypothetical protein n=1 Tax=Actinomadura verrucosospora TaxID=46165 RepID=UPI0031EF5BFB